MESIKMNFRTCGQLLLHLLLLQAVVTALSEPADSAADDRGVLMKGDITLGGLFPINSAYCGRFSSGRGGLLDEQGLQRLEAMAFSLWRISADYRLLRYGIHKIQLGGLLLDSCPQLRDAGISSGLMELLKSHLSQEFVCSEGRSRRPARRIGGGSTARIFGVVGASMSDVTAEAARLLQLLDIPQISYASSASFFSDRNRFPLLARSLPPDTEAVEALADVATHFNWTFVSVVHSDSFYGRELVEKFRQQFTAQGGCGIAAMEMINRDSSQQALDSVVQGLLKFSRARTVVLLTWKQETQLLLEAVNRARVPAGHFAWLAVDSVAAAGSLSVQLDIGDLPGFAEYFTTLTPGPRTEWQEPHVNHYFDEFWEQQLSRRQRQSSAGEMGQQLSRRQRQNSAGEMGQQGSSNSSEVMQTSMFVQDPKVQFVSDAVYTFAHGLDKVIKLACSKQDPGSDTKADGSFQQCVRNITDFPGRDLYSILIDKSNSFVNTANRKVEFRDNGDGIVRHVIHNYQMDQSTGQYGYRAVGQWHRDDGLGWSSQHPIVWPGDGAIINAPASTCSDNCGPRQRKIFASSDQKCCWLCANCLPHQTVSEFGDECLD